MKFGFKHLLTVAVLTVFLKTSMLRAATTAVSFGTRGNTSHVRLSVDDFTCLPDIGIKGSLGFSLYDRDAPRMFVPEGSFGFLLHAEKFDVFYGELGRLDMLFRLFAPDGFPLKSFDGKSVFAVENSPVSIGNGHSSGEGVALFTELGDSSHRDDAVGLTVFSCLPLLAHGKYGLSGAAVKLPVQHGTLVAAFAVQTTGFRTEKDLALQLPWVRLSLDRGIACSIGSSCSVDAGSIKDLDVSIELDTHLWQASDCSLGNGLLKHVRITLNLGKITLLAERQDIPGTFTPILPDNSPVGIATSRRWLLQAHAADSSWSAVSEIQDAMHAPPVYANSSQRREVSIASTLAYGKQPVLQCKLATETKVVYDTHGCMAVTHDASIAGSFSFMGVTATMEPKIRWRNSAASVEMKLGISLAQHVKTKIAASISGDRLLVTCSCSWECEPYRVSCSFDQDKGFSVAVSTDQSF